MLKFLNAINYRINCLISQRTIYFSLYRSVVVLIHLGLRVKRKKKEKKTSGFWILGLQNAVTQITMSRESPDPRHLANNVSYMLEENL